MRSTSFYIFLIKLIKIPISLWIYVLMANFFGVSKEKDVWLVAYTLIISIDLAIWGPLNDIFRTKFIFLKSEEGEEKAVERTRSLLFYIIIISILIMGVILIFPDVFINFIAPNYQGDTLLLLRSIIRILAPILLINQLTLILTSVLNAYNTFYVPEIAAFITQLITIAILFIAVKYLGIYSLVASTYVGLLVLLGLLVLFISKKKINLLQLSKPSFKDFQLFFIYALPLFLPYLVGQVNIIYEKQLLSFLPTGAVSVLDFGKKFPDMLSGIMNSVIFTVLIPNITKHFYSNKAIEFNKDFANFIKLGLLILGFFFVFMFFGADEIVNIFYKKSTIDSRSLQQIAILSILYSLSIIGVFFYVLFGVGVLSMGKNKLNGIIGVFTQISVIVFNFIFIQKWGIYTFPMSILLVHLLSAIYMFFSISYFDKYTILRTVFKYILYIAISFSILYFFYYANILNIENDILKVIFLFSMQLFVFILLGIIMHIEEVKDTFIYLKKKFI